MINIFDLLVLNMQWGVDVNKVIKECQTTNDCTEKEAIDAMVDKYIEAVES